MWYKSEVVVGGTNMSKILEDNALAVHKSFLYYLHEEDSFHIDAFHEPLQYLKSTKEIMINEYKQLSFVLCQTLRHIVYNFYKTL